ncbi:hypothetical protein ABPG77_001229 [Micractinium sp. CCAP 211/92]
MALRKLMNKKQQQHLQECERRMQVAEETYRETFGDDFDRIVPVYDHGPQLLPRLDRRRLQREQLQARLHLLEKQGAAEEQQEPPPPQRTRRPAWRSPQERAPRLEAASRLRAARCGAECSFDSFFDTSILLPQGQIEQAQIVAAEARPGPCFFATFRSAQAAAYAAQLNLNPLQERMMRWVGPSPAPSNVNYTALLRGWLARGTRPMVVFIFVLAMLLFPIGTFAGIRGTIVTGICGGGGTNSDTLSANGSWFCSDDKFAAFLRTIISSVLPSILLSVWQAVVLPLWFYTCAQAEGTHYSFTSLHLRCGTWFFPHDLFHVCLGGMLGGSVVYGLRQVIEDPMISPIILPFASLYFLLTWPVGRYQLL